MKVYTSTDFSPVIIRLVPHTRSRRPLGNIVEEANVSQFSRAGNNVAETNFAARKLSKKMFLLEAKNVFASRTQILLPKHMFPSLATPQNNLTRNNVSYFSQGFKKQAGPLGLQAR